MISWKEYLLWRDSKLYMRRNVRKGNINLVVITIHHTNCDLSMFSRVISVIAWAWRRYELCFDFGIQALHTIHKWHTQVICESQRSRKFVNRFDGSTVAAREEVFSFPSVLRSLSPNYVLSCCYVCLIVQRTGTSGVLWLRDLWIELFSGIYERIDWSSIWLLSDFIEGAIGGEKRPHGGI